MSNRAFRLLAVLALAFVPAACDKDVAGSGGDIPVGVVNVDKVAEDLGWQREMKANFESVEKQLSNAWQDKKNQYDAEVNAQAKRYGLPPGAKLTPQQDQELGQMIQMRQQVLGQLQQAAQQRMGAYRGEWIKQYRDALDPAIRAVANEKRVRIILMKNDGMMFVDTTTDLTDAVTAAAKAKPPILSAVPIPQLPPVQELPAPGAATRPATSDATPSLAPPATAPKK
jgi:Skp family chaperone for outer membrane proteins